MEFDINTFRGILTALMLIGFIGVVIWAYSSKRKPDFDEAASLALEDEQESEQRS